MNPVRTADRTDQDAIFGLDATTTIGDRDRLAILRAAVESGRCLVFDGGEGVTGFVVTIAKLFFGRDFIALLIVDPVRRRNGIGRALLRAAISAASTTRVFTSTNRSNTPMRALLDRAGWYLSGELVGLDEADPEMVYFIDRKDC